MDHKYSSGPDNSNETESFITEEKVESTARRFHDAWSKARMEEGWVYGPVRDDKIKQHPCLIPYENLPETEKKYAREAALAIMGIQEKKNK